MLTVVTLRFIGVVTSKKHMVISKIQSQNKANILQPKDLIEILAQTYIPAYLNETMDGHFHHELDCTDNSKR